MGSKVKENYRAWILDPEDSSLRSSFYDWAKWILQFALLSPSSHNSQPWLFRIEESKIFIFLNKDKKLLVGDPENRLIHISLGCILMNIRIVADYYGINLAVYVFPEESDNDLVAKIEIRGNPASWGSKKDKSHLIHQITKRSVNRGNYLNMPIPNDFYSEIEKLNKTLPQNIFLKWFSQEEHKKQIGEICAKASTEVMGWPGFLKELSRYIKNNLTKSKYGIPAFGMDIPTPISFFAPTLISLVNMDKLTENKNIELFAKHTPLVGVLSSLADSKSDWVSVGEYYFCVALLAEKFNLKTGVWGAPVVLRKGFEKLKSSMNIKGEPQLFFRLGQPLNAQPHSPRYSLQDVLIN